MDRYDVVLLAVADGLDRRSAVHAASWVLEVDRRELDRMTASLPVMVREDVDERSAELLLDALQKAGWRVRLVKRAPLRSRPPSMRPEASELEAPLSAYPEELPELRPASALAPTPRGGAAPGGYAASGGYGAPGGYAASGGYGAPGGYAATGGYAASGGAPTSTSAPLELELDLPTAPPRGGPFLRAPALDAPAAGAGAGALPPELELDLPVPRSFDPAPTPGASTEPDVEPQAAAARDADPRSVAVRDGRGSEPVAHDDREGDTLAELVAALPQTLLVPVRGGASRWLLLSLLLAVVMLVLTFAALGLLMTGSIIFFVGVALFALAASAFWIGHLFAYFRACLWAVIGGEEGPDPPGTLDSDGVYARVFDGAVVVFAFLAVNVALALTGGLGETDAVARRFTVANALLGMHSPIGLALMAVRQTRHSYFDVITAGKLLVTAPIHMAIVLTLAFALSHVTTLALGALTAQLGASLATGSSGALWLGVPGTVAVGLALTLLQWGVLGAVMGAVCRARPGLVA